MVLERPGADCIWPRLDKSGGEGFTLKPRSRYTGLELAGELISDVKRAYS